MHRTPAFAIPTVADFIGHTARQVNTSWRNNFDANREAEGTRLLNLPPIQACDLRMRTLQCTSWLKFARLLTVTSEDVFLHFTPDELQIREIDQRHRRLLMWEGRTEFFSCSGSYNTNLSTLQLSSILQELVAAGGSYCMLEFTIQDLQASACMTVKAYKSSGVEALSRTLPLLHGSHMSIPVPPPAILAGLHQSYSTLQLRAQVANMDAVHLSIRDDGRLQLAAAAADNPAALQTFPSVHMLQVCGALCTATTMVCWRLGLPLMLKCEHQTFTVSHLLVPSF